MRFITLLPIFFFGCAVTDEEGAQLNEAALNPAPAGPTVNVEFTGEGTYISVYPVRLDTEGALTWIGAPLTTGTVKDGLAAITLPSRAPMRDRDPEFANKPVNYWIFAQQLDEEGTPSQFLGVGIDQLSYFNGKDRKRSGWYVASPGEEKVTFASTDRIVRVDTTIKPSPGVMLAGHRGAVEEGPVMLGFEADMVPVVDDAWTTEIGADFSFSVTGAPPVSQETENGDEFATLAPRAFLDADEDGVWGEADKAVGWVCYGARPVLVSYLDAATSIEQAFTYSRQHVTTGWHAVAVSEEGQEVLGSGVELALHEDCSTFIESVPDAGDGNADVGGEGV